MREDSWDVDVRGRTNGAAGCRGANRWYRWTMGMTEEGIRELTIAAMTSARWDERIAWALRALDLGAPPSPNLCALALLSVERTPNLWEVEDLFRRSVRELGLPRPAPGEYLRQHAREVGEAVIRGAVRPVEGGYRLRSIAKELGDPRDMAPWHGFDEDVWLIDADEKGGPRYSGDMEREIEIRARALLRAIPKQYF